MQFFLCLFLIGRVERITDDDLRKCDEFVTLMEKLYASTLAISSESNSTSGQILPIKMKLEKHYAAKDGDSSFVKEIKSVILKDLQSRYQVHATVVHTVTHNIFFVCLSIL